MSATGTACAPTGTRRSAIAAVATVVLAVLTSCATGGDQEPEPSSAPTTTASVEPSPTPTSAPTPTEVTTPTVTVYSMVDTRTGLRLVRESRDVPDGDLMVAAVEQMIAGPLDPDYTSPWNPMTEVLGVSQVDGVVVVDLSADARTATIGSPGAALMIQQLVYTVTDAAQDQAVPVLLQIDGVPAGELWGAVSWDAPVTRESPDAVRAYVQIDEPRDGADVTSPVTVSGDASAFEANVPWQVLDADGSEIASGATLTSEGQTFAPYSFSVELPPGTYTIVVTEDDPSDGAGGVPMSDTKTITVS
ncbi:Gmad2 immunoglobulin-like domain-containing protein [Cellulomonas sp. KRMCY2]|uniref:Gmad2 immunoglobulin-like domain-containing protein n=1 Tax=Cellulomonas sp. KRMCY2 TaxID=1304865 RepID=UPI00045E6C90|nr:Gmad2 immunoglobulin-like domain-containing protein [Cellulomonas sp. KRMCY2]